MCLAVSGEILAITDQSPPAARDGGATAPDTATPTVAAAAAAMGTVVPTATAALVEPPGDGLGGDPLWRVAEVDFGGVRQLVSLACLPEARVGDRVLVHVGLALSVVEPDGELELADLQPAGRGAS